MEKQRLILVLDAQGGGMGAQLVRMLAPQLPADCELLAVGTNVLATNAMIKAGAPRGRTPSSTTPSAPTSSWGPSASFWPTAFWARFRPAWPARCRGLPGRRS